MGKNRKPLQVNGLQAESSGHVQEILALRGLTVPLLRERYLEVFGEPTASKSKPHLIAQVAWGMQFRAGGSKGLGPDALRRVEELGDLAFLRVQFPIGSGTGAAADAPTAAAPRPARSRPQPLRDPRLPPVGTDLVREYRSRKVRVKVLETGFEFGTKTYKSLSAIARLVTGHPWSGTEFFGLYRRRKGGGP